jgi:hypothetical protein
VFGQGFYIDWGIMTQQTNHSQSILTGFRSAEAAEKAREQLLAAGFSPDRVSIQIQEISSEPPIAKTEAARSAKGGAIAGAVFGAFVSFLLVTVARSSPDSLPVVNFAPSQFLVGLIGAVAGAFAGSLIAALAGANVPKADERSDRESLSYPRLIMLEGTEEERIRAGKILEQKQVEQVNWPDA